MCNCNNLSCSQCQMGILNNQSSIIPNPLCAPNCPPIIGCTDPVYTNCVYYTGGNLLCSGGNTGEGLNIILSKLDTQICGLTPPSGTCTVQVDANDTCCGYLNDKIQTTTLVKTINNSGGCESIQIEDRAWLFTNVNYSNGYSTPIAIGYSPVRYGVRNGYPTTTNLLEVRLHGQLTTPTFSSASPLSNSLAFSIPPSVAPSTNKFFNGIALGNSATATYAYFIVVKTNGEIRISVNRITGGAGDPTQIIIPFDGINYIKN